MLRLEEDAPEAFRTAFIEGFVQNGGYLPQDWRRISLILDTPNLAEFLARGPGTAFFEQSRQLILAAVERGEL
jgi:hypothetical protein